MQSHAHKALLGLVLAMVLGCAPTPGASSQTGQVTISPGGTVRQFSLPAGSPSHLELGQAGRLWFAISASESSAPSFQFRVQSASERTEADFHRGDRELLKEPGALVPAAARRVQAADNESFWINTGDSTAAGDRLQQARRVRTTAHAYFYVDQAVLGTISDDQIATLADTFENRIYPTVTGAFGADPATDPTGEPHVFIVLSPAVDNFGQDPGLMGYFWSRDMLAPGVSGPRSHSNQKKAVFLTNRIFQKKPYTTYGTLAHEFTHLCVFNQKSLVGGRGLSEDTWLDEGWAMLAMDLCGYGLRAGNEDIAKDIKRFLDQPDLFSLTDWSGNPKGFSYGESYLFTRYLFDRFGAVRDFLAEPSVGIEEVGAVTQRRGAGFQQVFGDWAVANAIQGLGATSDPRFRYGADLNLRGTYGTVTLGGLRLKPVTTFPQSLPATVRPWGTLYYDLVTPQNRSWSFEFQTSQPMFGSAVQVP